MDESFLWSISPNGFNFSPATYKKKSKTEVTAIVQGNKSKHITQEVKNEQEVDKRSFLTSCVFC